MVEESYSRNLSRAVKALKKLESMNDGKCVACNARVYRDACVVLRHGFWIAPGSFHEKDCPVASVMNEMMKEIIPEDEALELQRRKEFRDDPKNKAIFAKAKKILADFEEMEQAKFN